MKTLSIIVVSFILLFCEAKAETNSFTKSNHSFIEWNVGIAHLNWGAVFPGSSVLWGQTRIFENELILEYELGLAFPTIVTGKIGIGKKFKYCNASIGIRPFPFNLFVQSSFLKRTKGYWIASAECNPLNKDLGISFESNAVLNIGYRWKVGKH